MYIIPKDASYRKNLKIALIKKFIPLQPLSWFWLKPQVLLKILFI